MSDISDPPRHTSPSRFDRSEGDRAVCRKMIQGGSRSFYAASLLLPQRVRDDAYALYAFCRLSDDLIDLGDGTERDVARLRRRLQRIYDGQPMDDPVDRAMAELVARRALPQALPEALIEGLEWDAQGRAYDDLSDVFDYAARVAGAVGAMMCVLMDVRDVGALARACDLGVAMQLTNIARDVGEDARNGRLYLPRRWFADAGLDPDAWLEAPTLRPEIQAMTERLLAEAEGLYKRAMPGIAALPFDCRLGVAAARRIYREIGVVVEKNGFDNMAIRARVSGRRKAQLAAYAAFDILRPGAAETRSALDETAYLVRAAEAGPPPRMSFAAQLLWAAELLKRLEVRQKTRRISA